MGFISGMIIGIAIGMSIIGILLHGHVVNKDYTIAKMQGEINGLLRENKRLKDKL